MAANAEEAAVDSGLADNIIIHSNIPNKQNFKQLTTFS